KALAWRHAKHGHDPYSHSGTARRQSRRVDGKGQRRAIPQVTRNTHDAVKEEFDMNLSFQNKVALVTGAGSRMGLVTARAFAKAGAAVALADVNEKAVRSAAEELVAAG